MFPQIAGLYVYPVKSCGGIELEKVFMGIRGIEYDREWMIATPEGMFLTQRQIPRMCLIKTALTDEHLVLRVPGAKKLLLPLRSLRGNRVKVQVWKSVCIALDQGDGVAETLTAFLGRKCRLVHIAPEDQRKNTKEDARLAFADGYPLLGISQESLDDLNTRLAVPIPMNRFRPNIVFKGVRPYEEDIWEILQIGSIVLRGQTRCSRCAIPGTDQETGKRNNEPLKTLAGYRRFGKIFFGRNFSHKGIGGISLGQTIAILN